MGLRVRSFTESRNAGGVLGFLGLITVVLGLAGGLFVAKIMIPTSIEINLVMFAIGLTLITVIVYLGQIRQSIHLGRIKFTLVLLIQPISSVFLLALIYYSRAAYLQDQPRNINSAVKVSAISMILFFIILCFLLSYIDKFTIRNFASPSMYMGVFIPVAFNLTAYAIHISVYGRLEALIGMLITTFVFCFHLHEYRLLLVSPFDRRSVIDSMNLGWVIVDQNEIILDMNSAAELILGQPLDKLIGHSGKALISNWSTLFPVSLFSEKEMQASLYHEEGWLYFQVRSMPLIDNGKFIGRVLVWNDNTEHKKGEELRKRTLDTTLGLLHSISLAASHSTDIRAFLETVIFQIVTSFSCTTGFIFLREPEFIGEEKALLELVGSYSTMDSLDTEQIAQALIDSLTSAQDVMHMRSRDLLSGFDNLKLDEGMGELVLCPILIESQTQGAVVLFRPENSPFIPDEIIRLAMLANELSTLVHVEQQRNGFASMVERKKLIRILHDTVTQQLYGLLYFIDVAQAQLETGTINSLSATLERLSQTGRQALKEMRMFLYSLQPVNISKTGFIAAINHRLDSVEGRASVKTQFTVIGEIKLTLKQEVCLYEIALEALNNIIRHASAKTVSITIKQFPKNIQLEIVDDGRGFDVKVMKNSGGLGLKNMKESAKQIHAKISIQSNLVGGTRVKVLFPRARVSNIHKNK